MIGFLRFLRLWTLVSIPVGILVGKLLKTNRRATTKPVERP